MTIASNPSSSQLPTRAGLRAGVVLGLPVTPGVMAFGLVVGAAAERHGLSFVENVAMNVFVCSGIAQLVALEIWPQAFTWGWIAALAGLTAIIGARLFLMSVSLRPWLDRLPKWMAYSGLYYLTDGNWIIAMRYLAQGGRDAGVYFGATLIIVGGWFIATSAGYFLGSLVIKPEIYGLDLVMPVYFAAMLVPLWAGARNGLGRAGGWLVAGVVAVVVERLVPGWWFIVAGSIAGAIAGGFLDEEDA